MVQQLILLDMLVEAEGAFVMFRVQERVDSELGKRAKSGIHEHRIKIR